MKIDRLRSGGLITNYYCTSACRHCLYACSPKWEKRYITEAIARTNLSVVKALGCSSLHIGGGEPFLDVEGLKRTVGIFRESGVSIDYIETNSSWFKDKGSAITLLSDLRRLGVHTLLISISPFHNEFIPFNKVRSVIETCRSTGVQIFPWVEEFLQDLQRFDVMKPHSLEEYEEAFGRDYISDITSRYWISMRGRALKTYASRMEKTKLEDLLAQNPDGCAELTDTTHFHVDLFGNYIPGLCSGLLIECCDLGNELNEEKYPLLAILSRSGISGLYESATKEYGFQPFAEYVSKCELCQHIRGYLASKRRTAGADLGYEQFYREIGS